MLLRFLPLLLLYMTPAMAQSPANQYVIVLHGGAGHWNVEPDQVATVEAELAAALTIGSKVLSTGGTSLDAVESAIAKLEDSPWFNAGKGSCMNSRGEFELDASIMDGRSPSTGGQGAGAVAAVSNVKNPIRLARHVMQDTRHVLMIGAGAEAFAQQMGTELVEEDYFRTGRQEAALKRVQEQSGDWKPESDGTELKKHGTVGCVALDSHGNLAAGTSTGGIVNKRPGRVGDSPIIGAGTYADNATCAVSCTGVGELFIKQAIAYDLSARMKYSQATLAEAAQENIHQRLDADTGGLIAIDREGHIAIEFNTQRMAYGVADSAGQFEVKLEKRK